MDFSVFVDMLRISLNTFRERPASLHISNISAMATMSRLQEKYVSEVYMPELAKIGMQHLVVIVSPEAYNKMIVKRINRHGIQFYYCDNYDCALALAEGIQNNKHPCLE